jgi:probable 2-oxoglutarate dehydrogenase E1 component DHKTD1
VILFVQCATNHLRPPPENTQFMHMPSKHERRFLEKLLERSHAIPISPAEQRAQWELLAKSEGFDNWAAKRFPNVKRYGLEGGESMMTAVAKVLDEAHASGFEDVVIGMPHRGRLNLLTQLLDLDMRLLVRKVTAAFSFVPEEPLN